MRIQHNIAALNSYRQLDGNNNNVAKNLEKLSSGYRVNRAGDDAAGLAISEKMRAQIKGLETAQKNALDGISMIQTAEGAMTEIHSMLNRMVELATQAANGIYGTSNTGSGAIAGSGTEREAMQAEIDALMEEINRIAKHSDFNGTKLLDGSLTNVTLQVGDTGEQVIAVKIEDLQTSALGVVGGTMLSDITVDTVNNANSAIAVIKAAINQVSTQRGNLGALQNRLEHTINNLGVATENITAAESRIRDTDMAKEMMAFTKNNILTQAAQAMLAQANMIPQGVLQLLQ